jgi:hypothetical protein
MTSDTASPAPTVSTMTPRDPTDDEDICRTLAQRADSEGYTAAEFRQAIDNLLATGLLRRVPYRDGDGALRHRIEPAK